jgi:Ca2+-transporting ATPase
VKKEFLWHSLSIEDVFEKTNSSESGLNFSESKQRLKKHGLNILEIKASETIPRILLRQLKNPIVHVLLISTLLAFSLKKITDGTVILSVVILNTIVGFIQEYRANRIIRALSALMPHKATVLRCGQQKLIPASHLVPGDVIFLQAGDKVPADVRLLSLKNFHCDESLLTGESLPVAKRTERVSQEAPLEERKCMAFSGTHVTTGTGVAVVVETGLNTEFGRISELIEHITQLETPLSITLKKIARRITLAILIASTCFFIIGYLRGSTLFDSGLAAVALAVSAIPESLPAIVTIASSIGVRRMARRQAIVRQLPAVEALGSTTVICTDKTGTLTNNEMTVQQVWTQSGFSFVTGSGFALEGHIIPQKGLKNQVLLEEVIPLLRMAILCSDATLDRSENGWVPLGDPTEIALVISGRKVGLDEEQLRLEWQRQDVIPFEATKRLMATLNASPKNGQYIYLKGAPEEILVRCDIDETTKVKWLKKVDEMATDGMRVLAFAEKEVLNSHLQELREEEIKSGFVFLGFIGMIDPPRKEVFRAIKSCHEAGIAVKMVTGDHPITAQAIGRDLGFLTTNQEIITGEQLNQTEPDQWREIALKCNVFARVSPEHKLKLVMALQEQGHVVAMTGDGVNDAPALKRADIGITMGIKGTAVAKEAADIVLADDNFASIEAAVEEGRRVYDNLIKSLAFILPTSLGLSLVILIAILFFPIHRGTFLHPMQPVQILWVNLIVAIALALPLAFETPEPNIMKRPPRKKGAHVLSGFIFFRTITVSLLMALGTIGLFLWKYNLEVSKQAAESVAISEAQTMAVTAMILFQIFYLFHCRSLKSSVFQINFFSNPHLLIGVIFVLLAQFGFVYIPIMNHFFYSSELDLFSWIVSLGVSLTIFLFVALEKIIVRSLRFFFE